MSKTIIGLIGLAAIVGAGVFLTQTVLAEDGGNNWFGQERRQGRIEQRAEKMGITVDELKDKIQQTRLENKAEFLGMTVGELEEALKDKTFRELVEKEGKTEEEVREWREEMHKEKIEKIQEMWKEEGLSDEEITERLDRMQQRHEKMEKFREEHGGKAPFGHKGYGCPHFN